MTFPKSCLAVLFLFFTVLLAGCDENTSSTSAKQSVSERIQRTGEIRCGYSVWAPLFALDPNTKAMSGIFYDLMEEAAKRLAVKIVWQEELGWDTAPESVRTHRVDMACAGFWLSTNRIKAVSTTKPLIYSALYVWVRGDESRIKNLDQLNDAQYRLVQVDGGGTNAIAATHFPKAETLDLPGITGNSDLMTAITTKKADFLVDDESVTSVWLQEHPGSLKKLSAEPLAFIPLAMLLPPDDPRLKEMMDNILLTIELDGTLDRILKKYGMDKIYMRNPAPSYR